MFRIKLFMFQMIVFEKYFIIPYNIYYILFRSLSVVITKEINAGNAMY